MMKRSYLNADKTINNWRPFNPKAPLSRAGWWGACLLAICLAFFVVCCSLPVNRVHVNFSQNAPHLKSLGVVDAGVRVYDRSEDGLTALRDDWSRSGRDNLVAALQAEFQDKNYAVKAIRPQPGIARELEEVRTLYRAVSKSIQLRTYGPQLFPNKVKNFDYAVGPITDLARAQAVDALVFFQGEDQGGAASDNRKTYISLGIADADGTILWYGVEGGIGAYDLRNSSSARTLVAKLLTELPEIAP